MAVVLLCDDHKVMREALAAMLLTLPAVTEVFQAGSAEEVLARYGQVRPDCVVMDVRLPGIDGVAGTVELLSLHPEARVLLLSGEPREQDRRRALAGGARGFLGKDVETSVLLSALGQVASGKDLLSPGERRALMQEPQGIRLSPREREVLEGMALGRSNQEIGVSLWVSESAIKGHAKKLFCKIGVHDRAAAVAWAFRAGLLA
jgi:DNA-binding NarL/FixJ family response regulator